MVDRTMQKIPVVAGSAGQPYEPKDHEYKLAGFDDAEMGGPRLEGCDEATEGATLCSRVLRQAAPRSLIVQIQSGFTDVADLIDADETLFKERVAWVSIMGGTAALVW